MSNTDYCKECGAPVRHDQDFCEDCQGYLGLHIEDDEWDEDDYWDFGEDENDDVDLPPDIRFGD